MRIRNRYHRLTGSKGQRIPKKKTRWLIPEVMRESLRKHLSLMYLQTGLPIINTNNSYGILTANPYP